MGNIIYIIAFLGCILLLAFAIGSYLKKINLILLIVMSIGVFFAEYVLFSSLLLMIDKFYVSYGLGVSFIVNLVFFFIRRKHLKGFTSRVECSDKSAWIALLLVIICAFFTWGKAESITPNADNGLYGQHAVDMLYGTNSISTEVPEYAATENAAIREAVFTDLPIGLYKETAQTDEILTFQYHGFPAWPTVLALFATMFGLPYMTQVLTILFICISVAMYFFTAKYAKTKVAPFLAVLLFAFSPLVINMAKNIYSEVLYAALLLTAMLAMMQENKSIKMLGLLPLCTLPFLHIATFQYAPLIVVLLLYLSVYKKEKTYIYVSLGFTASLLVSLVYAMRVSPIYMGGQFRQLLGEDVTSKSGLAVLCMLIAVLAIISFVFLFLQQKRTRTLSRFQTFLDKRLLLMMRVLFVIILVVFVVKGYLLGFTDHYQPGVAAWVYRTYGGAGWEGLVHLNIIQALIYTSFFCIPYLIYKMFSKKTKWGMLTNVFLIAFVYCMAVLALLRTDFPLLYFIARYNITFLMPATIILVCLLIEKVVPAAVFAAITIAVSIPANLVQFNAIEYKNNFRVLKEVSSEISDGSIVIIDYSKGMRDLFQQNLREMNGCYVFPSSVASEVLEEFPNKKIYLISNPHDPESLVIPGMHHVLQTLNLDGTQIFMELSGYYPMETIDFEFAVSVYLVQEGERID
ncbi:MAG: hypothetical protein ACOYJB_05535 [Christensenellaceae bacterium]|jgi:hypothetical protein